MADLAREHGTSKEPQGTHHQWTSHVSNANKTSHKRKCSPRRPRRPWFLRTTRGVCIPPRLIKIVSMDAEDTDPNREEKLRAAKEKVGHIHTSLHTCVLLTINPRCVICPCHIPHILVQRIYIEVWHLSFSWKSSGRRGTRRPLPLSPRCLKLCQRPRSCNLLLHFPK